MKTFTLLIWEAIPETLDLYMIPNDALTNDELKVFDLVQEKHTNCDKFTPAERRAHDAISIAVCVAPDNIKDWELDWPPEEIKKWAHRFVKYKVDPGSLTRTISFICRSGYMC